ncbi:hypothetical protein NEIFL0001_1509 [Neisseria flavescens SK114]|nr:hypothetical protein NEIFL0001_1509 [Neisseria flavescens SK114]
MGLNKEKINLFEAFILRRRPSETCNPFSDGLKVYSSQSCPSSETSD